ncbi:amylo-alpha-1,6-glucosidase, partial [candidate division KSB1 bacterium]
IKVIHNIGKTTVEGKTHNPSFILTNKIGGYFSLSNYPISRYQGAFFCDNFEMFKVVENIIPLDAGNVIKLTNKLYCIERERESGLKETIFMPLLHNSIGYQLSKESEIQIDLDCKKAYDDREFGRFYKIYKEKGKFIIEYTKKTDKKEDSNHGKAEYKLYVVIDNGKDFKKLDDFYPIHYSFDKDRGSWPWERHVYKSIVIKAKRMVISFSNNKNKAIKENDKIIKSLKNIREKQEMYVSSTREFKDEKITMAYKASCSSMDHLVQNIGNKKGVYAGLWWFFQYWTRDEAISLKALMLQGRYDLVKDILFRQLKQIREDGRLSNRYPPSNLDSADGIGWVMKRCYDLFEELYMKDLITEYLSKSDLEFLKKKVEDTVFNLRSKHTGQDFAINNKLETWMDTDHDGDYREGIRIEIQALRLCMYKLMKLLCKTLGDNIGHNMAVHLETDLVKKVREKFWNGRYLDDGVNDKTIRPNIFIAYYVYPELLTKPQWQKCFKFIMPKLWNSWGGLSTIDKGSPLFCNNHTGQNNQSYHRGDSWYWINNLAALCLAKVHRRKFREYIDKIVEASTEEILFSGAVGHHAEISSANNRESKGCFMQAWSAAMYIEMIDELFSKRL